MTENPIDKASFKEYTARFKFKTNPDEFQCPKDNMNFVNKDYCESFGSGVGENGCTFKNDCGSYKKHILKNTNI